MSRKAFTVEEANALIPVLELALDRIRAKHHEASRYHDRLKVLELLWGDRLSDPDIPDREEAERTRSGLLSTVAQLERLIRTEILNRGVRFPQGGLEHGLIDFPTTWEGRWVFLCWRRGEPAVGAWHEVDAGFAGRQPVTPEHARRMGRDA